MKSSFAQLRRPLYVIACAYALAVAPLQAQQAPLPELDTAQQAVQRAADADADQYAPDLLALARQELQAAQSAAQDRRQRKQAPGIALRAAADADLARARSDQAAVAAQLAQRRNEVQQLQKLVGTGAAQ
ncbi:DUF4398 domain-containing protein [Xanthomonas massiliensis]|uniref:DUF4398 domain-containing protein n=1 Tax=Xanthomonas massiliensis TaxID=1720302 RepID=UPI000824AE79|nr:DUF4398 domain-containing protein [Xanthomonas massiliensis]